MKVSSSARRWSRLGSRREAASVRVGYNGDVCFLYKILLYAALSLCNPSSSVRAVQSEVDTPLGARAFGRSLAMAGSTLAVGDVPKGTVYLYDLKDGAANLVTTLQADANKYVTFFGYTLQLSDPDTLLVGSSVMGPSTGSHNEYPAATLYRRNVAGGNVTWEESAYFSPIPSDSKSTTQSSDSSTLPAASMQLSRNTLALGSHHVLNPSVGADANDPPIGVVHLYDKGADTSSDSTFRESDITVDDEPKTFGATVAIDRFQNNMLVVGCPNDSRKARSAGAVYLFALQQDGVTGSLLNQQVAVIALQDIESSFPHDKPIDDYFGYAVAVRGDYIAVSAHGKDDYRGAVYLFSTSAPYDLVQKLTAPDASVGASFGESLTLTDSLLVVSAMHAKSKTGKAYIYQLQVSKPSWKLISTLGAGQGKPGDLFGSSVAVSATSGTVAVGAPYQALAATSPNATAVGSVHLFVPPYPDPSEEGSWGWIYTVLIICLLVGLCICLRRRAIRRRARRRRRLDDPEPDDVYNDDLEGQIVGDLELQPSHASGQTYVDEPDSSII